MARRYASGGALRAAYLAGGRVAADPQLEYARNQKTLAERRAEYARDYQELYNRILSEIGSLEGRKDMQANARLGTLEGYLRSLQSDTGRELFVNQWREGLIPGLSAPPRAKPQMKSFLNQY
jgi:hypothetical protein